MKRLLIIPILLSPVLLFGGNSIAKASGLSDGMLLTTLIGVIVLLLIVIKMLADSIEAIINKQPVDKTESTKSNVVKTLLITAFMGSSYSLQAGTGAVIVSQFTLSNTLFWILIIVITLLLVFALILFRTLLLVAKKQSGFSFEEEKATDLLSQLKLTDNVPIQDEVTVMMDHEYDGIRELDNNLPPWWKYMFYATIIFSFIYIIRFHITGDGKLSHEEYMAEMTAAQEAKEEQISGDTEMITEENVTLLIDAASIEKGAAIYKGNCATCHGQLGEGGAGPNLADEYWLHGGGIKNVFKSIKYGIPAKGMIAWQNQFNPEQIQKISSYVMSLQGTDPPNAKDPQGEIYNEEVEDAPVEEAETLTEENDSTTTADL